ncbi:MAG: hypothetical protein KDI19_06140 [Pseudomonadales bacterium]|nr:hypothetical protein [Pseudomonadales bacterium]
MFRQTLLAGVSLVLLGTATLVKADIGVTEEEEMAIAEKIVGPIKNDDNCSTCHTPETDAWQYTRHFATFKDRHRSDEAREILEAMGERSMKRAPQCRQCHYTNEVSHGRLVASFGVSCESCHGPARDWLEIHSKVGGDLAAADLKWGTGKNEDPASRAMRLSKAQAKGMINSSMIYEIAKNCYGCHTVPNESVVNMGGHKAGSDFDLVAWSQGEVRHNFASSKGAPDAPTNRPATPEEKRRLYVTGLMVDLETSLRNIAAVKEKGGKFHMAMVARANDARSKIDKVLAAVKLPGLADAVGKVPANITTDTTVDPGLADGLSTATRAFVDKHDGTGLAAVDSLIPTEYKGKPYEG